MQYNSVRLCEPDGFGLSKLTTRHKEGGDDGAIRQFISDISGTRPLDLLENRTEMVPTTYD